MFLFSFFCLLRPEHRCVSPLLFLPLYAVFLVLRYCNEWNHKLSATVVQLVSFRSVMLRRLRVLLQALNEGLIGTG